jgi:hypothetical protein
MNRVIKFFKKTRKDQYSSIEKNFYIYKNIIIFTLFGWVTKYTNIDISQKPKTKLNIDNFQKFWNYWIKGNQFNASDVSRLLSLLQLLDIINIDEIKGDFAEVGVYKGNSAKIINEKKGNRVLWLFDTFSGFDEKDLINVDASVKGGFKDTSLESVKKFIGVDQVIYVSGYFPESIPNEANFTNYSFVHIDCDLYLPAKAALRYFYPRLSAGGIILIHDYFVNEWDGINKAVDEFVKEIPENILILPDVAGSAVIRKHKNLTTNNLLP